MGHRNPAPSPRRPSESTTSQDYPNEWEDLSTPLSDQLLEEVRKANALSRANARAKNGEMP